MLFTLVFMLIPACYLQQQGTLHMLRRPTFY